MSSKILSDRVIFSGVIETQDYIYSSTSIIANTDLSAGGKLTVTGSTSLSDVSIDSGAKFNSHYGLSAIDFSYHIALYSTTYGFSVTSGQLNYVVPVSAAHKFVINATDIASIEAKGIVVTTNVAGNSGGVFASNTATNGYSSFIVGSGIGQGGLILNGSAQSGYGGANTMSAGTFANVDFCLLSNNIVRFTVKAAGWCVAQLGVGTTAEYNIGTAGATKTVDWSTNGCMQKLTLTTATACTLTFTAPPYPCWLTLKTISPAAGTVPAITWPATVKWAGATKPVQAATLGSANIQRLYFDGTNYWGDAIVNCA